MTARADFNVVISDWLDEQAGRGAPDYLGEILARTTRTRQRPAWSSLERWLPVNLTTRLAFAPSRAFAIPALVLLVLALVAVMLVLYAGGQPRPVNPFGVAGNGQLAYSSNNDIYLANADRSNARPIVEGPSVDVAPVFARDGTRILFLRELGLDKVMPMSVDSDGRNVHPLAEQPLIAPETLSWSPSGAQIVVLHRSQTGQAVISLMDTDGHGALRRLDLGGLEPASWVDWRPPDGREVIFRAHSRAGASDTALYSIGADGTNVHPITKILPEDGNFNSPSVSPDGSRLAYWNFEPSETTGVTDGWTHVLDLGTGRDQQMRFAQLAAEVHAVFSPDGRLLLVERQAAEVPYPAQMIVVPIDASGPATAIGPAFPYDSVHDFGFSPDGQLVVLSLPGTTEFFRISDGATIHGADDVSGFPTWQRVAH